MDCLIQPFKQELFTTMAQYTLLLGEYLGVLGFSEKKGIIRMHGNQRSDEQNGGSSKPRGNEHRLEFCYCEVDGRKMGSMIMASENRHDSC